MASSARSGCEVSDWVRIDDVQVYPDVAGHKIRVRVSIANPAAGSLTMKVDAGKPLAVPISGAAVEAEYPLAAGAAPSGTSSTRRCTS